MVIFWESFYKGSEDETYIVANDNKTLIMYYLHEWKCKELKGWG